ncbi:MAG: hypothetical protein H6964_09915 [Chromatiaceae bacterium]|nr:hypothetical protein [Gammaproteobacteria bacterium]MCP5447301.1 hypothetical protein [Chromatiaceae bacterium]
MASGIRALLVIALLALGVPIRAASFLTVGPDDPNAFFSVPNALTGLTSTGTASPITLLPDGSIGYNGGLATKAGSGGSDDVVYAVGNDSLGKSTLFSFSAAGTNFTTVLALGDGFNGGLAYNSAKDALYLIQNDFLANSTLYRIALSGGLSLDPVGALGAGFFGGLTYNADDGLLYAISGDDFGVQRVLNSIDAVAGATVTSLFELGDGSRNFNGGLVYEPDADLFYAIANDFVVNSTLTTFDLTGSSSLSDVAGPFGQGFVNVGLTLVAEFTPQPIPEPEALWLMLTAAPWWLRKCRHRSYSRP